MRFWGVAQVSPSFIICCATLSTQVQTVPKTQQRVATQHAAQYKKQRASQAKVACKAQSIVLPCLALSCLLNNHL